MSEEEEEWKEKRWYDDVHPCLLAVNEIDNSYFPLDVLQQSVDVLEEKSSKPKSKLLELQAFFDKAQAAERAVIEVHEWGNEPCIRAPPPSPPHLSTMSMEWAELSWHPPAAVDWLNWLVAHVLVCGGLWLV